MKDAYSFHENDTCLNQTYDIMFNAYKKFLRILGLNIKLSLQIMAKLVEAKSHEFHVIAENGEDELIF